MKKVFILTFAVMLCRGFAQAQTVNVTFRCNVATVPDTMGENSMVQLRGTVITPAGRTVDDADTDTLAPGVHLAWNGYSTMFLEQKAGDYWEATFPIPAGAQLCYKFFTNASHDTVYSGADWEHRGWEASINKPDYVYGTDRGLDLSTFAGSDTTLPLQFVNGVFTIADQFFKPYVETDSVDIWFRVNMQTYEALSPETHIVGVRGGMNGADIGDLSWDRTFLLTRENKHTDSGAANYDGKNFWSGRVRIANEDIVPGQPIEYLFVVMDVADAPDAEPYKIEEVENRALTLAEGQADTTLHWVWFENIVPPPIVHGDNVKMTFTADMARAIQNRGFSYGDTLEVRVGYFSTASQVLTATMKRQGFTSYYKGSVTVKTTIGEYVDYQYYSFKNARDYREIYYNFYYEGESTGESERRQVMVEESPMTIADTLSSQIESRRMPIFRNVSEIAQDVLVTFTCDLRPAYYTVLAGKILEDVQGNLNISDPEQVLTLGLAMNGPATGSWSNDIGADWGSHLLTLDNKRMYDDGTHGDVAANDTVYSIQFTFTPDTGDVVGQEFKFGIGGGDNEGGEGGYGNNHIENIDDSQPESFIHSQFGSINPVFYSGWNYDTRTGIHEPEIRSAFTFELNQNYPNPFNPTTSIAYSVAEPGQVVMTVYNVMGRRVRTLVDEEKNAGQYTVQWHGTDQNDRLVGTGLYFVRIEAGDFVKTRKMMLLK